MIALAPRYVQAMTRGDGQPVLVTGATGRIGRLVVDALVGAGVNVRALTRRPADAELPSAVDVVHGDFTEPDSLDDALCDVSAVFLVWTLATATAPAVVERLAQNAQRVVFLSAPHRTPHPFFQQPNPMAKTLDEVEQLIAHAGLTSTVVRPGMFATNALHWWAPAIRAGQPVRWPYTGVETAPVDERDVAEVAARILCDAGQAGGDYVLTGPESLSQADQIRVIGDVIGRQIIVEDLTPEEFRRETEHTWPPPVVDMLLTAWGACVGLPAYVTSSASDILGRPARTFRQWAADHANAFD